MKYKSFSTNLVFAASLSSDVTRVSIALLEELREWLM